MATEAVRQLCPKPVPLWQNESSCKIENGDPSIFSIDQFLRLDLGVPWARVLHAVTAVVVSALSGLGMHGNRPR